MFHYKNFLIEFFYLLNDFIKEILLFADRLPASVTLLSALSRSNYLPR